MKTIYFVSYTNNMKMNTLIVVPMINYFIEQLLPDLNTNTISTSNSVKNEMYNLTKYA